MNVTARLLLGFVTGLVVSHIQWQPIQQILGVGLLGGYSTFGTASVEGAWLIRQKRYLATMGHAGGMFTASIVATALSLAAGSTIWAFNLTGRINDRAVQGRGNPV